jgi:hypothetical protein
VYGTTLRTLNFDKNISTKSSWNGSCHVVMWHGSCHVVMWHGSFHVAMWHGSCHVVMCAGWYYTHTWKAFAWPLHFTVRAHEISHVLLKWMYQARKVSGHVFVRYESGRFGALKSNSTHHFFRNACTKSGSLRFSQFSDCWLILSVYIRMSFDFPFVRLFGVR